MSDWRDDEGVKAAEEAMAGLRKATVMEGFRSGKAHRERMTALHERTLAAITRYRDAVAKAVLIEVQAAPTDHIRKQVMARLLSEIEGRP